MTTAIIILTVIAAILAAVSTYHGRKLDAINKEKFAIHYYAIKPVIAATSYLDAKTGERYIVWHETRRSLGEEEYNKLKGMMGIKDEGMEQ